MNTKQTEPGRVNSGVIRVLNPRGPLDEQREDARRELSLALVRRGIAHDPGTFREREFVQGAATYFEVSVEHDPLTEARRDELVHAFELGQMSGRYVRQLIAGKAGTDLGRNEWAAALREGQRNPWRGDLDAWPDDLRDPHVAFVLAYAWRLGYDDGAAAVEDERPLRRPPYMKPATLHNES